MENRGDEETSRVDVGSASELSLAQINANSRENSKPI